MERLQTSTVPTSDSVATATVVDGFTTAQIDQLGDSYAYTRTYSVTGITSSVTDPRGNTSTQKTDLAGRAIEQTDAANNSSTITYCTCCDPKGRIANAGFHHADGWKDFSYSYLNGTSILTSLTHPSGIVSTRAYEAQRNLITSIADVKGKTTLSSKPYTYDTIGRPTARNINTRVDTFGYNSKSELTSAALGTDNYAYNYDNIGNRKTAQEIAEEITYDSNSTNEYTAIGNFTPEYDLDGNQTKIQTSTGIWSVIYNAENRPINFTNEASNTIIEARYDHMGRRAWKKVTENGNSSSTTFEAYIYRGYLQIASEGLKAGQGAKHFITWDPTEPQATRPLSIEQLGTWFTYGLDLSKNITELYTNTDEIATSYRYSPFGAVTQTGNTNNPLQWSSEIYDSELALTYYNYRHYNPSDGRWINRDPIGIEGGLNLYVFVGNKVWLWDELGTEQAADLESGYIGMVECERTFIRKTISSGKTQFLKSIGLEKFSARLTLERKACKGCCKDTSEISTSRSVSLGVQVEGEARTTKYNIYVATLQVGWYLRLGGTSSINLSSSCNDKVAGGGGGTIYLEAGLIAQTTSRIGELTVGARGGLNGRLIHCVNVNGSGQIEAKAKFCFSLRARVWTQANVWLVGKVDFNKEWQSEWCTDWVKLS